MKIYFIGIGGIGVSAIAQYYLTQGHQIFGSDLACSEITEMLKKQGAKIIIEQKAKNIIKDIDLVIYSPAVKEDNPELKQAKKFGIKCLSYPEALGSLTKKHFTIAVSGTHGKSTTTAMLALVLIKAGLDPTVIIGTKLKEFNNTNFRAGKSKYLLIEVCEHEESFLNYSPNIIIINNIDSDHLDYYKNLKNILKTFIKFITHLSKNGTLVINKEDKNIQNILELKNELKLKAIKIKKFSFQQKEAEKLRKILKVPGQHNIYNGLAALTAARILNIKDEISFKALSEYTGCWRRFEIHKIKISDFQIPVIFDYAHHPTEIKAVISGTKDKFFRNKIWAVFQPHQYQRTFYLFKEFSNAFAKADEIILTKIYDVAGREDKQISMQISAEKLAESIKKKNKKVHYVEDFKKIPEFLKKKIKANDVILIIGAGNIYELKKIFIHI